MRIAYGSQIREIDRITIEETGIPEEVLMENAGHAVVYAMAEQIPDLTGSSILILCGPGNNGGDGFVAARLLNNLGFDCSICLCGDMNALKGAAKINATIVANMGIPVKTIAAGESLRQVFDLIQTTDVIVDALFGTGLHRPLSGIYPALIDAVNDSDAIVVSVDLPSGMSADTCTLIGPTINADLTITFGLPKPALVMFPSAESAGQVVVADISIPRSTIDRMEITGNILTPFDFPNFFQPRAPDIHKGRLGHLLILAGSPGKTGAAILGSLAAARAGAGLVTLAIPEPLNPIIETALTEVMSLPLPGTEPYFSTSHINTVIEALAGKSALLIGPGIGTRKETADFLKAVIQEANVPMILDADALNIIAATPGPWFKKHSPRILTPHPGEFSRLTDVDRNTMLDNPVDLVTEYAVSTSSTVVYKSARTIIAFPNGRYSVNITGNPGLATGGSGDILAGMIAGLATQSMDPFQASAAGVFWHGLTGDFTVLHKGEREMLAGDMLDFMWIARKYLIDNPDVFDGSLIPYPPLEHPSELDV